MCRWRDLTQRPFFDQVKTVNLVDLIGELLVDFGDECVYGVDRIVRDQILVLQHLLGEVLDCGFHVLARAIGFRPELLAQKGLEVTNLHRGRACLRLCTLGFGHRC